jgi:PAS domain S-box-containing protein
MKIQEDRADRTMEVRRKAETLINEKAEEASENLSALPIDSIAHLLHELRVHEVELAMQNEELRRAQVELEAAKARYFDLYDLAPMGYCTVSEIGVILEANLTAATLLGVARTELIGSAFHRHVFSEDRDVDYQLRGKLFATDEPQSCELRFIKRDGVPFWARLEGTAVWKDRKPVCHIAISDISQRVRAEEEQKKLQMQLHQAQKLESVGRLAGGVAHDFNNMLSVILGHAQLACDELDASNPLRSSLEEIVKAAKRSVNVTRQLLTFASQQTVLPQVQNLEAAVTRMIEMLRRLIGENIQLVWRPSGETLLLNIDASQIDQILVNLCVNARDAIVKQGRIVVETNACKLSATDCANHPDCTPGDYVRLTVSDNGHGMDAETLTHIFEPFFTTKDVGKGTGLGLATVYGAVKQNKGFIDASSELERGSSFSICLPRHQGQVEAASVKPKVRSAVGRSSTILVVEDEEGILDLTTRVLERLGYTVLPTNNPDEALKVAKEHRGKIDLLLTDVIMPIMNGHELAVRLTELHPKLKCLFMSGYPADIIAEHGVLEEGVQFLQKPFLIEALSDKVREVLGDKSQPQLRA